MRDLTTKERSQFVPRSVMYSKGIYYGNDPKLKPVEKHERLWYGFTDLKKFSPEDQAILKTAEKDPGFAQEMPNGCARGVQEASKS